MEINCITNLKNIIYSDDIIEIKKFLIDMITILKRDDCDKSFEKKIISQMKREINKYRQNFKKKYPKINNLYIYPENQVFLYFCSNIIDFKEATKSKFNMIECIETFIEILDSFEYKRIEHISFEEQIELLFMTDEKFELFSLLNFTDKSFNIYNFPCLFNDDSCEIMFTKTSKKTIIDLMLFDLKIKNVDVKYLYSTLLGRVLNFVLIDNLYESPYGMARFLNKIDINYRDMDKNAGPIIFSQLFAISLLFDSIYKDILDERKILLAPLINKYVKEVIEIYRNDKELLLETEFESDELCPCGSDRLYGKCCKNKRFKWIREQNKIKRKIPIHKDIVPNINNMKDNIVEILGRKLLGCEKVFRFMSGPDFDMNEMVRVLREIGLPENKLYASYKTGLFLSEYNIDLLPDYEYNDWMEALDEYENLTKDNEDDVSYIECINMLNEDMKNVWEKYLNESFSILNMFINDVKDDLFINNTFEINDISDFIVFCVRRVIKNGQALINVLKSNNYEVSMSIVRMLYEDLVSINVYIKDNDMYNKYIMPLVLIEKGIYKRFVDDKGNVSTKYAVNPKTGEKFNYSITLKDLSKKARDEYNLLYDELFRDLSAYTHLNITVKDVYFSNPDPFFEIERINIAGILGLFFINQIIYELSNVKKISDFAYRDLLYFSDKVKEKLIVLFKLMKEFNLNEQNLYDTLIVCVSDYDNFK